LRHRFCRSGGPTQPPSRRPQPPRPGPPRPPAPRSTTQPSPTRNRKQRRRRRLCVAACGRVFGIRWSRSPAHPMSSLKGTTGVLLFEAAHIFYAGRRSFVSFTGNTYEKWGTKLVHRLIKMIGRRIRETGGAVRKGGGRDGAGGCVAHGL